MSGGDGDKYQQQQQQQELREVRDIYFIDAANFILFVKSTIMMDKDIM
jgi:hypothetical protein